MTRQGSPAIALATMIVGAFCLTGCAAIGDIVLPADPLALQLAGQLDRDDWRVDSDWSPADDPDAFRWEFAGGEPLAELPAEADDTLPAETQHALTTLATRRDRVGWNAVILLGRHAPSPSVAESLAAIVRGESAVEAADGLERFALRFADAEAENDDAVEVIPIALRSAAAETWCRLLAAGDKGMIEARLAAPGRVWRQKELPETVRGELIRGLARHLPPERIVGYDELFPDDAKSVSIDLRRAAIDGCLLFATTHDEAYSSDHWPATIDNAQNDPDSQIRRDYGRWLAHAGHPQAVERLRDLLHDRDPKVAQSAVRSLGSVGNDEARTLLLEISQRPAETLRAAAVEALAEWGPAELDAFLEDESVHVRRAAVAALAGWPSAKSAVLLDASLTDRDLDVQRRAVEATSGWPDEFALPVLLSGLENAAVRTRRQCLGELRRRTGFKEELAIGGDPIERAAAIRELAATHHWPQGGLTRFRLAVAKTAGGSAAEPPADVAKLLAALSAPDLAVNEFEALLTTLRDAKTAAVPAIEKFCIDHPGTTADRLATDVLPAISETHAALAELGSTDVAVRRQAAGRLAELGRSATLSPFALDRLHRLLTGEQDGLVWRQAMVAIAADATPGAERIALLAVNNTWPDLRRLGCEYVGRHGRSNQAAWLLPLLGDQNDAVRQAAIEAVGRCGSPALLASARQMPGGLQAAAVDRNQEVRLAALTALARLGDEAGSTALLHWAEYESPSERLKAIRAIASTGLRRFEPELARMAWMERDAMVRRELLSGLEALVPSDQRPPGAEAASVDDRLAAWASRWEGRPGSSTMAPR